MQVSFINSIAELDAEQWNSVSGTDYPFTRYEFLHALEVSKATEKKSGWQPQHALIKDGETLIAVMPLYLMGRVFLLFSACERRSINAITALSTRVTCRRSITQQRCLATSRICLRLSLPFL